MRFQSTLRVLAIGLALVMGLVGCGADDGDDQQGAGTAPSDKTELAVATDGEPGTFDWQQSTSGATQTAAINVFETLYAVNAQYEPVPMLASAMPEVSDDGLTFTVPLRDDVVFHDETEMDADDVVASLDRWGEVSSIGQAMYEHVEGVTASGDHEIEIVLSEPYDVTRTLAVPVAAAAIMPDAISQEYGIEMIEGVDDLIGTGPFQLTEWSKGDRYVLERFDAYAALPGESDGLAGNKTPSFDTVTVSFVPDANTRLTSTGSGQYDVALAVPGDLHAQIESSGLETQLVQPFYSQYLLLNTSEPPFDDAQVREAAALAIDPEAVAQASFGNPDLYELSGSLYPAGLGALSGTAAVEDAMTSDVDAAASLLDDSAYDGQPVTFMTVRDEPAFYNATVRASEQLEQAGFNVEIDVMDYATMSSRYTETQTWDLFSTAFGIGYILPSSHLLLSGYFPFEGWYANGDEAAELVDEWHSRATEEERAQVMDEIQAQFFADLPAIRLADYAGINAVSTDIDVSGMSFYWPTWWDARTT